MILRETGVERCDHPGRQRTDERSHLEPDDRRSELGHQGRGRPVGPHRGGERLDQGAIGLEVALGPPPGIQGEHIRGGNDAEGGDLLNPVLGEPGKLPELLGGPGLDRLRLARQMAGDLGGELPIDGAGLIEEIEQLGEEVVAHGRPSSVTVSSVSASARVTAMLTVSPARLVRSSVRSVSIEVMGTSSRDVITSLI